MHAKLKDELKEINMVVNEQQDVLDGVLSDSHMSNLEEAKEKLAFIRSNKAETVAMAERIQQATQSLSFESDCPNPVQLMASQVFKWTQKVSYTAIAYIFASGKGCFIYLFEN